jgi:hypothetical protein
MPELSAVGACFGGAAVVLCCVNENVVLKFVRKDDFLEVSGAAPHSDFRIVQLVI